MTFCVVDFFRPMNMYRTKARISKLISVGTSAPMPDYYYEDEIKVSAAVVIVYAVVLAMTAATSEMDSGVGDERTG
jgi:hypothetical protein